jgi:hypothetical protein
MMWLWASTWATVFYLFTSPVSIVPFALNSITDICAVFQHPIGEEIENSRLLVWVSAHLVARVHQGYAP